MQIHFKNNLINIEKYNKTFTNVPCVVILISKVQKKFIQKVEEFNKNLKVWKKIEKYWI